MTPTFIQVEREQAKNWLRVLNHCRENLFLKDYVEHIDDASRAIKQALAAPVQKPIGNNSTFRAAVEKINMLPSFLAGWKGTEGCRNNRMEAQVQDWIDGIKDLFKIYSATPPAAQRQWVDLTDDDLIACSDLQKAVVIFYMKKLKERNHG
jgi:hypothetical protein